MSGKHPILVQGLSKRFCRSLRRSMIYGVSDIMRDLMGKALAPSLREAEFYALDGLDFEVEDGECLGVIGPNGSGKSTLLKLLTGIYPPDKGSIRIRGRVAALIELAAGFHPLLSGRENIFVSGAILGMKRAEIRRRLDEIIAFSGLERFIDTPVKSYSSGMYVRLGFAVMAHLEAEVLLIDEVLAVGDTAFRIKSMNKIREMVSGGTTCMIVTHDLYQISALCNRALVLDQGRCVYLGGAEQAVSRYLDLIQTQSTGADDLRFEQGFRFESVTLNETSEVDGFPVVTSGRDLEIRVDYRLEERIPEGIQIGVLIKNGQGHRVTGFTTLGLGERLSGIPGRYSVRVKIRRNPLLQGFYSVSLSAFDQGYRRQLAGWQNVVRFGVETPGFHSLHQVGDMLPDVEILS